MSGQRHKRTHHWSHAFQYVITRGKREFNELKKKKSIKKTKHPFYNDVITLTIIREITLSEYIYIYNKYGGESNISVR